MIRDRGNIKWTSMMLPEHVKELREWKEEDRRREQPELDEQKMEEMNDTICEAMAFHQPLTFHYFKNGTKNVLTGYVHYIDQLNKELRIVDLDEKRQNIPFASLVHIGEGD
ncbi:YolD-like family protein [Alkalihalobacillus sp. CinArs1]|uniref:YolD-like family protein n=1 Tax=Alkalihalobacillus sp. CinArs1 TaxID=2995314 RepID=UPI0022DE07C5|nr:YolD-like family protein [Alkalihalobacillus sp. CinArs1]